MTKDQFLVKADKTWFSGTDIPEEAWLEPGGAFQAAPKAYKIFMKEVYKAVLDQNLQPLPFFDETEAFADKWRANMTELLETLFDAADTDGDGEVTFAQWEAHIQGQVALKAPDLPEHKMALGPLAANTEPHAGDVYTKDV